jgi:flavin-dependent dehydrogenase
MVPGNFTFDVPFIVDYDPDIHPVPGYTVRRDVFDAFMLEEVKRLTVGEVYTICQAEAVSRHDEGYIISAGEKQIKADLLIDASGTSSKFITPFVKPKTDAGRTALAVRAYYSGVSNMHESNYIELYFLKGILPGYFWIFPMREGKANVGIGLRKDIVLKKKINLSAVMQEVIKTHPAIAPRFKNAVMMDKPAAYSLPLGNPKSRISGDGYMLAGDAAHLVDRLTGEGVGNALYSGYIAAEQAIDCISRQRFDADFMQAYDRRIKRVLGKEMTISRNLQRMLHYPGMVRMLAKRANRNKHVARILSSMYTDLDYRKKLVNPWYLLRVLINK